MRNDLDILLDSNSVYLLAGAFILSVAVTLPRFGPGIPMSVDTTSHLYRILFFDHWLKEGVFPFWSPDWYAGSPAILLYPPLGYYIVLGLSQVGLDPVFSYKVVDAVFYWLAPLAVYFLSKELGLGKGESALGALIFSVVPEVIENYIFFDRFPTVLSVPIFCVFILLFHRTLNRPPNLLNVLGSVLSLSALMLTHHLSALIGGIVAVLMVLLAFGKFGHTRPLLNLCIVGTGTVGLTAFWLIPFIISLHYFPTNPFYNRNVVFPFVRFLYFGYDVTSYLLGIAQFILAAVAVQSIIGRKFGAKAPLKAIAFFPLLLSGMGAFQVGEIIGNAAISYIGQIILVGSFITFLGQFLLFREARQIFLKQNGPILIVTWFLVFLWLGLGLYAFPILQLPYIVQFWVKTMDVYRIWLYLALPMSALAALGFVRSLAKLWKWRFVASLILIALVVTPVTVSVALKMNYAFGASVNGILPYSTANSEIPTSILNYFQEQNSSDRILGINVPFWIYVLPTYTNKPIIDGWYPQTKLVTQLVKISDYRVDDLETTPNQTRLEIWKSLISNYQGLDIGWVMIGGRSLAESVMTGTDFEEQLTVPYQTIQGPIDLVVYKTTKPPSLIDKYPSNLVSVSQMSPDRIVLNFNQPSHAGPLVVKEAFFPTWTATADGQNIKVMNDNDTGYIALNIPEGTHQIVIYQNTNFGVWNLVSAATLVVCVALVGAKLSAKRRSSH
jgi:hypothetical protein